MPRHDRDLLSLVFGVFFSGLGAVSLLSRAGLPARWVVPVLLISLGVTGLFASARRSADQGSQPVPGD